MVFPQRLKDNDALKLRINYSQIVHKENEQLLLRFILLVDRQDLDNSVSKPSVEVVALTWSLATGQKRRTIKIELRSKQNHSQSFLWFGFESSSLV